MSLRTLAVATWLWVGCASLGGAGVAAQETEDPNARDGKAGTRTAKERFERGARFLRQGRWDSAAKAFERSYQQEPRPGTAFNLALARYEGGHLRAALGALEDYERLSGEEGDHHGEAMRLRAALEARLAERASGASSAASRASAAHRERDAGRELDTGAHSRTPSHLTTDDSGAKSEVPAELPPSLSGTQWLGLGLGAAGTAALVLSGVFSVTAKLRNAPDGSCDNGTCTTAEDYGRLQAARAWSHAATISVLSGGAMVLAGALLLTLGGDDDDGPSRGTDTWARPSASNNSLGLEVGGTL